MARGPQDPMHSLAEGKILQVPLFLVLDFGSTGKKWRNRWFSMDFSNLGFG